MKDEKYITDKLAESAENVEVPKSLEPKNVLALLENVENDKGQATSKADSETLSISSRKQTKAWSRKLKWATTAIAACLVALCGIGVFATGLSPNGPQSLAGDSEEDDAQVSAVPVAASYDELYDILSEANASTAEGADIPINGLTSSEEGATRTSETEKSANLDTANSSSFSQTNLRTEGVDEADIVKTDGKVIYTLQDYNDELVLVKAVNGKTSKTATIKTRDISKEAGEFCEFFIENDRLYLIMTVYDDSSSNNSTTKLITYDVSNPDSPKRIGIVNQTGYYNSARLANGYLYLFTNFYPKYNSKKSKIGNYVPTIENTTLPCEDIYIPSCADGSDYIVVSSVNTSEPGKLHKSKAILAGASDVYVSSNSIYLYGPKRVPVAELARGNNDKLADTGDKDVALVDTVSSFQETRTVICKLSYNDGFFESVGETTVDGIVDDGFSIDEYQGYTRVITTVYEGVDDTSNNLYVLNEKLQKIGELTNIAPGEKVYSARLMGDIGYFVTYKQVDPLFSVDLSDPTKPTIIGQLKIPGFSEYLHPWSEGRLLGIGYAIEKSGLDNEGIKLSMFDISNPSDVSELNTYVIKNKFWAPVLYDYKAIYINKEKGLFGFSAEGVKETYYLFSYSDEKGFSKVLTVKNAQWNGACEPRGISIDDTFYVVNQGSLNSYDMDDFKLIDSIKL